MIVDRIEITKHGRVVELRKDNGMGPDSRMILAEDGNLKLDKNIELGTEVAVGVSLNGIE